jgi:hypothetical protein
MKVGGRGYTRFLAVLPLVAVGIGLPGCSSSADDLPRLPIAGRVLFAGLPLQHGMIMFYPEQISTKEHERVAAGSSIVNGWFSIPRDRGPVPGKYTVSVTSDKEEVHRSRIEREASPGNAPPPVAEKIPAKFNSGTVLKIEIKEGGIKELKFDLPAT